MTQSKGLPQGNRSSYFSVSGMKPELFPKALESGADMIGVDLEGRIAPSDKDTARKNVMELFKKSHGNNGANDGIARYVRINSLQGAIGLADVQAVLATDTPEESLWLDKLLTKRGHTCRLYVIIETNEGLEAAHDIGRCSPRIEGLFFGGHDMSAELRCKNAWKPLLYARSRLVHAAASAGINVIDTPFSGTGDPEGMKHEAILAREMGFTGKGSTDPKQISVLNEIFTPD